MRIAQTSSIYEQNRIALHLSDGSPPFEVRTSDLPLTVYVEHCSRHSPQQIFSALADFN